MSGKAGPRAAPEPEAGMLFNGKEKRLVCITLLGLLGVVSVLLGITIRGIRTVHALIEEKHRLVEALIEEKHGLMEALVQSAFEAQEQRIVAERVILSRELMEAVERLEETVVTGTNRTNRGIAVTNQLVGAVERVYADLLEEQKKKTLESLYGEEALVKAWEDAQALLNGGNYKKAHELFLLLTGEQPENQEAWFYRYYSLFLANRNDREQYRSIREGFMLLERNGYTRPEMGEVLQYITLEESGTAPFGE